MPDPRPGDTLIPPDWPNAPLTITQVGDEWVSAESPDGWRWHVGVSLIRSAPEPGSGCGCRRVGENRLWEREAEMLGDYATRCRAQSREEARELADLCERLSGLPRLPGNVRCVGVDEGTIRDIVRLLREAEPPVLTATVPDLGRPRALNDCERPECPICTARAERERQEAELLADAACELAAMRESVPQCDEPPRRANPMPQSHADVLHAPAEHRDAMAGAQESVAEVRAVLAQMQNKPTPPDARERLAALGAATRVDAAFEARVEAASEGLRSKAVLMGGGGGGNPPVSSLHLAFSACGANALSPAMAAALRAADAADPRRAALERVAEAARALFVDWESIPGPGYNNLTAALAALDGECGV